MGIPQTIQKFELYSVVLLQYPIPRLLVVVRLSSASRALLQELSAGVREHIFLETDMRQFDWTDFDWTDTECHGTLIASTRGQRR